MPTPRLDREMEKIEEMGVDAAIELVWEKDRAVRIAYRDNPVHLKRAIDERAYVIRAAQSLDIEVEVTPMAGNVLKVTGPVEGYLTAALKERAAVSIPEVGQVKGHGVDPCEEAILRRGGLTDLGTFNYKEWMKDV